MDYKTSAQKIKLNNFENLFGMSNEESRISEIKEIQLSELHEFNDHPFKVRNNTKLQELADSIKDHGVIVPGIARRRSQGGYEIIAGHSRKKACEIAGLHSMPMFIRNLSDDEAIVIMVDSNIQREDILPSEKAKAYKMKYEALKHQGKKGNSLNVMSEESGDNKKMIQRFIWLANLSDDLLEFIDNKKLGFTQGVNISFLSPNEQAWIFSVISKTKPSVSIKQSESIKKLSQERGLTEAKVWEILSVDLEKKKNRKITIKTDIIDKYFDDNCTEADIENIIMMLLDQWKSEQ